MSAPLSAAKRIDHLVGYAVKHGASHDALLSRLALSAETLSDPDARVPLEKFYEAIEYAGETLEDPLLSLHYIDELGFTSVDALGFLAKFSATVGESMERFVRYIAILSDGEKLDMRVVDDRATFCFELWGPDRPGKAGLVEMYAAGFLMLPQKASGAPMEVTSVKFAHRRREGTELAQYRRYLGAEPEFEAGENSWSFPAEVLDRPLLQADPELARFFDQYLSRKAGAPTIPFRDRVEHAVGVAMLDRSVRLSEVARRLRTTPRTLQRRLNAEGLSFDDIVTHLRQRRAEEYLKKGISIAEVSYLLGYADTAIFQRAFRRWKGQSPGEWRKSVGSA